MEIVEPLRGNTEVVSTQQRNVGQRALHAQLRTPVTTCALRDKTATFRAPYSLTRALDLEGCGIYSAELMSQGFAMGIVQLLLAALACGLLLGGCQNAAGPLRSGDTRPLPSVEEAQRTVASFQRTSFTIPPRAIDDVLESLARNTDVASSQRAKLLQEANKRMAPDASPLERVVGLFARARAAHRLGRSGQELTELRTSVQLVDVWRPTDGRRPSGSFLQALFRDAGWAESFDGNFERAVVLFRRAAAEKAIHGSGAKMGNWREMSGLALVTAQGGNLSQARAIAQAAADAIEKGAARGFNPADRRSLSADSPDRLNPWQGIYALSIEASLLELEGRWSESEPVLQRAINVFRDELGAGASSAYRHGRESEWAALQRAQLAHNLTRQGRILEAEDVLRSALFNVLRQEGTTSKSTAILLLRLGDILMARGRFDEVQELALRTISIFQTLETPADSRLLGEAQHLHAASLVMRGDWTLAVTEYRRVQHAFRGNARTYNRHLQGDPNALLAQANSDRAQEVLSVIAQEIAQQQQNKGSEHYDVLELQGIEALALARSGQRTRALDQFRSSVAKLIESDGERRAAPEQRLDRQKRLTFILASYVDLMLSGAAGNAQPVDPAMLREAFSIASYLQAGSVQAAIARSAARTATGSPELAGLIRAEQDARLQLEATYALLGQAQATAKQSSLPASLRSQATELRRSAQTLSREIGSRFPDYRELVNPSPPDIERTRTLLEADEAMLSFYVSGSRTYLWVLRRDAPAKLVTIEMGERELSSKILRLRRALEPEVSSIGDIPKFDTALAAQLYDTLVGPAAGNLADVDRLIIVPHGPLGYLPFALLVTGSVTAGEDTDVFFDHYRKVPWMARSFELSRIPSVASLQALRTTAVGTDERRAFVGFGDPIFRPSSPSPASTSHSAVRGAARKLALRSVPRTRNASRADLGQLPPLPETRDELIAIATTLKANLERDLHLGSEAREEVVKAAPLATYRVVAFATHGLAEGDLDGLTQPALALSAPNSNTSSEDGLLTMEEVLALDMNADWVILSACNTAAAGGAAAEAVSGLGRAFFYAGTRALLVSNWPVHSQATTLLTTTLFRQQALVHGITRAGALQQAMLKVIDEGVFRDESKRPLFSYAHPIFWAPFTLIGDARH